MDNNILYVAGGLAVLALVFAFIKYASIMNKDAGDAKMQEISKLIQEGAAAFLKAEYKWLAVFVVVVAAAPVAESEIESCWGSSPPTATTTTRPRVTARTTAPIVH